MATLAPPSADLPSHVWCVTSRKQHFAVRAPLPERASGNPNFILSFARRYHADMFRTAVCSHKSVKKEWPRISMESDYRVIIPGPDDRAATANDLEVDEINLVELFEKCTLNGVSIGLIDDFRAVDTNLEFKGTKIDLDTVLKIEDYRAHLNAILET